MTAVYHIKDWDSHFENNKSREREACRYVCMPNKQDGLGLTYILSQPEGLSIFGVWCLILQKCSRHKKRNGWLTADGHRAGTPWALDDLALSWRCPPSAIERALDVFCHCKVGWLECLDESARRVPAECPPGAPEGKGREEKGREGEEKPPPVSHSKSIKENRDRFRTFLARQMLASDDTAIEEWLGLATNSGAKGFDAISSCIEFCIGRAYDSGQELRFARHAMPFAKEWKRWYEKQKTETIRAAESA